MDLEIVRELAGGMYRRAAARLKAEPGRSWDTESYSTRKLNELRIRVCPREIARIALGGQGQRVDRFAAGMRTRRIRT
jgi:hypothetical protein